MLVIRLTRFGKKKKPFYRIVVADKRTSVSGKYIEKIGHFNPLKTSDIFVDKEKAKKWLSQGAKPSDTVWNLLVKAGILKKKIVTQRSKEKKEKKKIEMLPVKPESEKKEEIKEEIKEEKLEEVSSSEEGPPRLARRSRREMGRSASKE